MIEIKGISKAFGQKKVLENFSYKVEYGKMIAIIGQSGSGKSTLLNILGLLDVDYDGEILYDGVLLSKASEKKRNEYIRNHINYLFQNYALVDSETVDYNLLLALKYEKYSLNEKKDKINEVLEQVSLKNYNNKKIFTLSGGEQQRVALARAILKRGNIILADEPTGNLDSENSNKVMEILKKLQEQGKTIIIVTHNSNLASQCDDVIHL